MTLGQPWSTPPARRQAHTSSSSSFHRAGNCAQVVVAGTTAVGRAATNWTVTSWLIAVPSGRLIGGGGPPGPPARPRPPPPRQPPGAPGPAPPRPAAGPPAAGATQRPSAGGSRPR